MPDRLAAMLFLLTASIIWSFSFGLIGTVLAGLPSAWLAAVRLALATLAFFPFVRRIPLKTALSLFGVGAIQFGGMSLAYMSSFRYLQSHEVALFTVMTPVYVAVLNDCLSRTFHRANLLAAALAVAGAATILWRGNASHAPLVGFLLVELSNLCFASGQLAYREIMKRTPAAPGDHAVMGWLYLGGLTALLPFACRAGAPSLSELTRPQAEALLYLGLVVSGLSYFLWNSGVRRVAPGLLAVMNNLKIPLGVAVSILVFGEHVRPAGFVAGCLLIAAALIPVLRAPPSVPGCD